MPADGTGPRRAGATFAIVAVLVCLAAASLVSACAGRAPAAPTADGASPLTSAAPVPASTPSAAPTPGTARRPSNPEADLASHVPSVPGNAASFSLHATIDRGAGEDTATGWVLDIGVSGGVSSQSTFVTSDDEEVPPITVALDTPSAVVTVAVHVKHGYLLQDGYCVDLAEEVEDDPDSDEPGMPTHIGVLAGTKLTFELSSPARYACGIVVRPTKLPPATIIVRAMMDPDPDTDAGEGRGGAGWQYSIAVTGGSSTSTSMRTGSTGKVTFKVAVDLGSASVRIRERQRAIAPFLGADCWDVAGEDPIAGDFRQGRGSVTFSVEPGGIYACEMWNLGHPTR